MQTRLLFPIGALLNVGIDLQTSRALFDRIFEYLDLPVEIVERPGAVDLDAASVRGEVRFEDVSFRYEADGVQTLSGVDLVVAPGTKTAIVGETGSGKTTLGYLVARLYDVTGGRVTIDGVDVRDLTFASLARTVGLVSQETYLFHATIADNLRFARPDATDEQLAACTWLLREEGSGTRAMTEHYLEAHGLRPRVLTLGSNGAIKQAARAGIGVAFISRAAVALELEHGLLAALPVRHRPAARRWYAMCSTVGPRRAAVERFMTFAASSTARDALSETSGMERSAAKTARGK